MTHHADGSYIVDISKYGPEISEMIEASDFTDHIMTTETTNIDMNQ